MNTARKKVLIITYYWFPAGGSGVQRFMKFVKYLRAFGWEPIIYTAKDAEYPVLDASMEKDVPEKLEVIRTKIREPYSFYKFFVGQKQSEKMNPAFFTEKKKNTWAENISVWIRGNFFIPDARMFWIKPSVSYLEKYLKENKVDAIISTGPPHSVHRIALQLHRKLNIPWLADFRDPWTSIDFYHELKLTKRADAKHHQMEAEVLREANAVTVIGYTMGEEMKKLVNRNYDVITNGFDGEDSIEPGSVKLDKKFSIAHIGTMVRARNAPELWSALKDLLIEIPELKNDLEIKLVGKVDLNVKNSLDERGLIPYTNFVSYLQHNDVIKTQASSQVLLLMVNRTPTAKGIITGKVFEYLASGRPIVCIGPYDGDAARVLNEAQTGYMVGFDETEKMKTVIQDLYNQYKLGTLKASIGNIDLFSRKSLTKQLAEVLDRIVK
ncbi:glycosyl transferase family 1 [Bacteroidota bacterium]|nr:glycosyl transferase family 1 [Bacteroidota bacterium]